MDDFCVNKRDLKELVMYYISLKQEGENWDFKQEWHPDNLSLLHDIICMANQVSGKDGLIIIGVEDKHFGVMNVKDDKRRKTTQNLVDFLRSKDFAGGVRPEVHVETIEIDNKSVDVIIVSNTRNVPYYLKSDFNEKNSGRMLRANYIYTRVGDSNTPVNSSADPNRVEKLWKKRFGIDATAIQKFRLYLQDINGWETVDGERSWFYKTYPEFRIELELDESRKGYEYYCFSQRKPEPCWYNVYLKCWNTIIHYDSAVCMGDAELFTIVPEPGELGYEGQDFFYFYDVNTIRYDMEQFFFHNVSSQDAFSIEQWKKCIPVFESECERKRFIVFLMETGIPEERSIEFPSHEIFKRITGGGKYEKDYERSVMMVRMLKDFRENVDRCGERKI